MGNLVRCLLTAFKPLLNFAYTFCDSSGCNLVGSTNWYFRILCIAHSLLTLVSRKIYENIKHVPPIRCFGIVHMCNNCGMFGNTFRPIFLLSKSRFWPMSRMLPNLFFWFYQNRIEIESFMILNLTKKIRKRIINLKQT